MDNHFEVWCQTWPDTFDLAARHRVCKASSLEFAESYMERHAESHLGYRVMVIDARDGEWVSGVVKYPAGHNVDTCPRCINRMRNH